jgi:hypothetical protein
VEVAAKRTNGAEPGKKPRAAKARAAPGLAANGTASRTRRKAIVTEEMIRERAYLLSIADPGGSELDHWLAAERELLVGG